MHIQHDQVTEIIAEAAERHILPLWKNLEDHQVFDKGAGDLVTAADRACEAYLTSALAKLAPRSLVVGPFAVMVALVRRGETLAGWIYDPLEQSLLSAEAGGGSWLDGSRMTVDSADKDTGEMVGAVMTSYLPRELREYVKQRREAFANWSGSRCAADEYRRLVTGAIDFVLYHRTLVWDHAPGVLIAEEAGGWARRYDRVVYNPTDDRLGLICATSETNWERIRSALLPGESELFTATPPQ